MTDGVFRRLSDSPAGSAACAVMCLPFAGGGAGSYRRLVGHLPPPVEVWSAQPPGRQARILEPAWTSMAAAVAELADGVELIATRPFVLYGHSFGALLALEVARELRRRGAPGPGMLVVSGATPPQLRQSRQIRPIDPSRPADVEELGVSCTFSSSSSVVREVVLAALKADLAIAAAYRYVAEPALDLSVVAFAGRDDPYVPPDTIGLWTLLGLRPGRCEVFDGGHFFLWDELPAMISVVRRSCTRWEGSAPL